MNKPYFSVIVPAYNVESFLDKCIHSILNQNFKDLEIIIVDDGSTDGTGALADTFKQDFPICVRTIHQKNKGLGGARNTGIEFSNGDYLVFVDSDDFIRCDLLEKAYLYIQEFSLDIFAYNIKRVKNREFVYRKSQTEKFKIVDSKEFLINFGPSACNKIFKRSIFEDGVICFPEKLLYEDLATIPMTVLLAKRIGFLEDELYYYYQRENSIIGAPRLERVFEILDGFDRVLTYFKKNGKYNYYYTELEFLCILHILYFTDLRIVFSNGKKRDFLIIESYLNENFPHYKNNKYLACKDTLSIYNLEYRTLRFLWNRRYFFVWLIYYPIWKFKRLVKSILYK